MFMCPAAVGAGKRFFPDRVRLKLELADEHQFRNGVVFLNEAELTVSTLTVSEEVSPAFPSPRWVCLTPTSFGCPGTDSPLPQP